MKEKNKNNKIEKMEIKNELVLLSNSKYQKFNKSLCPDTDKEMLGIQVPVLRDFAKNLVKKYSLDEILSEIDDEYFEEILIQGFCIGYAKLDLDEKIKYIEEFIPKMDSWAITDSFVPTLKIKKKDLEKYYKFILKYIESNKEFEIRFAIISMLDYYITDEYVEAVLKLLDKVSHDGYYVKMAVAWTICEIGIKYNSLAMNYLTCENSLDKFTYNKALQKMIESRRISDKQKDILRSMKRKD